MSHYRRCYIPGGSFFFTVVMDRRVPILGTDLARDVLRAAFRDCLHRWPPFQVDAMVMLENHMHAIWTLPPEDADYSKRWGAIKKHYTQSWLALGGSEKPPHGFPRPPSSAWCLATALPSTRSGQVWEHALRDERDYARHFDYIHYNPVKHGLAECPHNWPYSTFHRWVKQGVYYSQWDCGVSEPLDFSDLAKTVGE